MLIIQSIILILNTVISYITAIVFAIIIASFMASAIKLDKKQCGTEFVVDKYITSNLFCEVGSK